MSKKVLILSTSPRVNSNSEALADAFGRGAEEAGHSVEKISLRGKNIRFCLGCFVCQEKGRCVIPDDMGPIKVLLDRANPLFVSDYKFRQVYFLSSAAEAEDEVPLRAQSGLEGWVECFPKARLCGSVFGGGVTGAGEIAGSPALEKARELGRCV